MQHTTRCVSAGLAHTALTSAAKPAWRTSLASLALASWQVNLTRCSHSTGLMPSALTSGNGGSPSMVLPGRALGELCNCHRACCTPGLCSPLPPQASPPTAPADLPAISAPLQPRLWTGYHPPVNPVQKAPSPTSLLKLSHATPGQGIF